MPLIVCTARKIEATAAGAPGPVASRSSSSNALLIPATCSRLSVRKSSAYWALSTATRVQGSAQHALHGLEHATRLERLDDEILRARLNRLDDERLLPHRAAHENLRSRILFANLAHGVDTAHVGHDDVHRHQIGLE